ncbi:hypothetical protein M9H77_33827 [Catharanthus roseus]|uniref:Uncharacterized protein n=1 Tax=Catharanthus roseus TaxID=4058 RepID=A0ACB9ZNP2_CATRO|nr:hypothetical protein M9H77_33827 [Catharanthus roseus]
MSCRGAKEEKTAKSDQIYRKRLGNMLVNHILKHEKKNHWLIKLSIEQCKNIQQKTNKSTIYFTSSNTRNVSGEGAILVHGFSWLYGSSEGEIELREIVNGLINTQMYNSPGISIALIFITVGIGFKLSRTPSINGLLTYTKESGSFEKFLPLYHL